MTKVMIWVEEKWEEVFCDRHGHSEAARVWRAGGYRVRVALA